MAKVEIADASVVRLLGSKGFVASTSYELRNGDKKTEYWTVWTTEKVTVGDSVGITGLISVRLDQFEDRKTGEQRQVAAAHINNPTLINYGQPGTGTLDSPVIPTTTQEEIPF